MIELGTGDLLNARAEAVVNTVNTVGVMGKGIALQFKRAFPQNFKEYAAACKRGEVQVGRMFTVYQPMHLPNYVINFPTKQHWREDSKMEYIESGLVDLVRVVIQHNIRSIAIPPLGCGNGGLDWANVKPRIVEAFGQVPDVHVLLFEPGGAPAAETMVIKRSAPNMTPGRALMLKLIQLYLLPDYYLGKIEAQKLAYFLQEAGQPLKLKFEKGLYGPFAPAVNQVLEGIEGHYISGLGDGQARPRIRLLPGAVEKANEALAQDIEAQKRLSRVARLIEGFETPYSMELLATVHWVAEQEGATSCVEALDYIREWNPRKRELMTEEHVEIAWSHLQTLRWI